MTPMVETRAACVAVVALVLLSLASAASAQDRPRIEVKCHVYQTARDAPLIPGKATVIRVHANWDEEDAPFDDEELAFHEARVRIRADGEELPEMTHTFWRPDWHTESDSIEASFTANHFGWTPTAAGDGRRPVAIRATLEFDSPRTGETFRYDGACPAVVLPAAPEPRIDYFLVKTGSWADEEFDGERWQEEEEFYRNSGAAWPGPWGYIEESVHSYMKSAVNYAAYNSPVGGFRPRYGGSFLFDRWWFEEDRLEVSEALWSATRSVSAEADIVVGFVPTSPGFAPTPEGEVGWAGVMMPFLESGDDHFSRYLGGKRLILVRIDPLDADDRTMVLAHEIGHVYGLCHTVETIPATGDPFDMSVPSARNNCLPGPVQNEGFSLYVNGGGDNVSRTEGNNRSPWDPDLLWPLMYPESGSASLRFMADEQYERMIESLQLLGFFGGPSGPAPAQEMDAVDRVGGPAPPPERSVGFARPEPVQEPSTHLVVSGRIASDGTVRLAPVVQRELEASPGGGRGGYRAELRDAAGAVLASRAFPRQFVAPSHGEPISEAAFSVALPLVTGAAEIAILENGAPLARVVGSASAPTVRLLSPGPDEDWRGERTIRWEAADADGDELWFDVFYSADGRAWAPLGLRLSGSELAGVAPRSLEAGPAPRIRVVASDGFHTAVAESAVRPVGGFRLLAGGPSEGDTVPAATTVLSAHFNRDLRGSSGNALTVLGPAGAPLSATVEPGENRRSLQIRLDSALDAGASYRVRVGDGLRDATGNALEGRASWTFHTAPDTRRPQLLRLTPMPGALGVAPDAPLVITVDESLDPTTVQGGGLRVETAAGGSVGGRWQWVEEARVAVFRPAAPWTERETYRVTLTEQVTDLAGNPLRVVPPYTFTVVGAIRPRGGR